MAAGTGPLHFVVVRGDDRGPETGSFRVAGATTAAAENMVQRLVITVALSTGQACCAVIENGGLPGGNAVANIALRRGKDVIH